MSPSTPEPGPTAAAAAAAGIVPGVVSVTFRQLAALDVLLLAADAGLSTVEWGGDLHVPVGDLARAEEVRSASAEAGIAVASYGSYLRAGQDDPETFAPVISTAAALGAPWIRVWAGTLGSADASPEDRIAVEDGIRLVTDLAAASDVGICLEFHPRTLTDTVKSTVDLLDAMNAGRAATVRSYWQPWRDPDPRTSVEEVRTLLPRLASVHTFSWAADGTRLPLADHAHVWRPVIAEVAADTGGHHPVLLEFVADDDPAAFRRDAATLLGWVADAERAAR